MPTVSDRWDTQNVHPYSDATNDVGNSNVLCCDLPAEPRNIKFYAGAHCRRDARFLQIRALDT